MSPIAGDRRARAAHRRPAARGPLAAALTHAPPQTAAGLARLARGHSARVPKPNIRGDAAAHAPHAVGELFVAAPFASIQKLTRCPARPVPAGACIRTRGSWTR